MYEFRKLAENVCVFVQPALIWYSTAGVIVRDRDAVVVDSLTNEAMTRSLIEEIRNITDNPVADPELPLEVLRTVHSFDPCIACAVHTIDPAGNEITNVKVM